MATELTCVLTALAREAMFFRLAGRRRARGAPCRAWFGRVATASVLHVETGMGAAATERVLNWVMQQRPARVLVAGFCGGLDEGLEVGCLVQPDAVCDEHGNCWPVAHCPRVGVEGRLVSVTGPILERTGRDELRRRSGAVAVDMESATAARVLREHALPFACLRAVSDDARSALPADLAGAICGEQVNVSRLLRAVLCRPGLAVELWRLARQTRLAARRLADGVEQFLRT